ncbi:hypothetical protein HYW46_03560 [Candidatus Daviesbacteria bacterium]|nr:hypothetical protein [Candidatus Daviesbacteria bacterium]
MAEKKKEEFDTIKYAKELDPIIKAKIDEINAAFQQELRAGRIKWTRSGYVPQPGFHIPLITCNARQILRQYLINELSKNPSEEIDQYKLIYPVWLASYQTPLKNEVAWDIPPTLPASNAA